MLEPSAWGPIHWGKRESLWKSWVVMFPVKLHWALWHRSTPVQQTSISQAYSWKALLINENECRDIAKEATFKLQMISEALFSLCKSPKDHLIQREVILRHYFEQAVSTKQDASQTYLICNRQQYFPLLHLKLFRTVIIKIRLICI